MDRIHDILNNLSDIAQKTYKGQDRGNSEAACSIKAGDTVQNINESCMHYGSVGTVEGIEELPDQIGNMVVYRTVNSGKNWKEGDILKKTPDQLKVVALNDIQLVPRREPVENIRDFDDLNSIMADDMEDEDEMEVEEPSETEDELEEYKNDFYSMNIGSLRAIMQHAHNILAAVDNPRVKENLTESWLQGKIAITEDYMRTIHDFVMYVSEAADTISAADRPGLWENIRKKKERMGKNYKPAKPGDKDRPDSEQWKKLQEKDTKK